MAPAGALLEGTGASPAGAHRETIPRLEGSRYRSWPASPSRTAAALASPSRAARRACAGSPRRDGRRSSARGRAAPRSRRCEVLARRAPAPRARALSGRRGLLGGGTRSRGNVRAPRLRSRRATIAAAARAPSAATRPTRAQGLVVVCVGQRQSGLVGTAARPTARGSRPLARTAGHTARPCRAGISSRIPARQRQQAARRSPRRHRAHGELEGGLVASVTASCSPSSQAASARAARPERCAGALRSAPRARTPRRAAATSGSPRRARTSPSTASASMRGNVEAHAREGRAPPSRRRPPTAPVRAGTARDSRGGRASAIVVAVLAAVREAGLEVRSASAYERAGLLSREGGTRPRCAPELRLLGDREPPFRASPGPRGAQESSGSEACRERGDGVGSSSASAEGERAPAPDRRRRGLVESAELEIVLYAFASSGPGGSCSSRVTASRPALAASAVARTPEDVRGTRGLPSFLRSPSCPVALERLSRAAIAHRSWSVR